ncbi:MAG: sigma-70 family RNA polymerase sigma factor [Phycisphaerae bacterium]|nr:sigma-70 family RNA polymerase sigma factor [Phycisphaerae bacterium]
MNEQEFIAKFERHRNYLRIIARRALPRKLQGKIDASDIVQETMIKAFKGIGGIEGANTQDVAAYLAGILRNHIIDECRKATADKRDVALERSIDAAIDDSSSRLGNLIPAAQSTPSGQMRLAERLLAVADALACLPDDQRIAVELHHLVGLTLEETAAEMQRSLPSVAGLLRRGLSALNQTLSEDERIREFVG